MSSTACVNFVIFSFRRFVSTSTDVSGSWRLSRRRRSPDVHHSVILVEPDTDRVDVNAVARKRKQAEESGKRSIASHVSCAAQAYM